jgi:hypothetical protein
MAQLVGLGGTVLQGRARPPSCGSGATDPQRFVANGPDMFGGRVALDGEYAREALAADRALSAKIFAATQKLLDNG